MNGRAFAVAAAAGVAAFALFSVPMASASQPGPGGGGTITPVGVGAGAGAGGGDPGPPGAPYPTVSTSSGYIWVALGSVINSQCSPTGQLLNPGSGPEPGTMGPPGAAGIATLYALVGPTGQQTGATDEVCPGPTPVPPPPPPPTPADVWAETPLPPSHIDFSPSNLGLTQLATWMWFTGPAGTVTATVTIRGYTVTTTAHPVAAYWWFGDGGSGQGPVGGSESQPSATHTYVNVGHYTVTLIVAWSGQYTFVGNGVPAETVQLGTVDGPATNAPYAVQEVRSVGVAPGSGQ